MYQITQWFLIIKVESHSDFFFVYDKAIQEIPDSAFNKKWYRSICRTFAGQEDGKLKYIIPLNQPTLKKIIENT